MTDAAYHPDDEIVSAVLDGEATEAERALVAGDPRLRVRLEELRAAAEAAGEPTPPADAARRDELIARALAAGPAAVAPVVSLASARRRRLVVIVGAAAAATVAVLAIPAMVGNGRSPDEVVLQSVSDTDQQLEGDDARAEQTVGDGADGGLDRAEDSEAALGDMPASGDDARAAPPTTVPAANMEPLSPGDTDRYQEQAPTHLGSFATRRVAQVAVSQAIDEALAADADGGEQAGLRLIDDACDRMVRAADEEVRRLAVALTFDLTGEPRQVLVYELVQTGAQNGTHRIYEVTSPGCAVVGAQTT